MWLGSDEADVTQEFLSIFGRSPTLDGDAYAGLDSPESIQETRSELARRRGIFGSAGEIPVSSLFTKAAQDRFHKAASFHGTRMQSGDASAFIFDASQSENRSRANQLLPAATKTCVLVSLTKQHVFTQNEIDFSMGWPVLGQLSSQYAHVLPKSLQQQSPYMRRCLSGNGMCLQQVYAWFLYVQSQCARRHMLLQWSPLLLAACYQLDDQDNAGNGQAKQQDADADLDKGALSRFEKAMRVAMRDGEGVRSVDGLPDVAEQG